MKALAKQQTETLHLAFEAESPVEVPEEHQDTGELFPPWDVKTCLQPRINYPAEVSGIPEDGVESTALFFVGNTPGAKAWDASVAQFNQASWLDANAFLLQVKDAFIGALCATCATAIDRTRDRGYIQSGLHAPSSVTTRRELLGSSESASFNAWGTGAHTATISVSRGAKEFIETAGLDQEFYKAQTIIEHTFPALDRVDVVVQHDPEDESAPPTLVLGITVQARYTEFRQARKRFFRLLRWLGCVRLCRHLAMIRE